jgi:hypothetical protein
MKIKIILAVCMIALVIVESCKKKSNGSPDSITVIDNGHTYTYNTNNLSLDCSIHKVSTGSWFHLTTKSTVDFPVNTSFMAYGPINSIGVYKLSPIDSVDSIHTNYDYNYSFTETFSGGEKYFIDSILVNISVAEIKTLIGDYKLWLHNSAGSKAVTGSIKCSDAKIE